MPGAHTHKQALLINIKQNKMLKPEISGRMCTFRGEWKQVQLSAGDCDQAPACIPLLDQESFLEFEVDSIAGI